LFEDLSGDIAYEWALLRFHDCDNIGGWLLVTQVRIAVAVDIIQELLGTLVLVQASKIVAGVEIFPGSAVGRAIDFLRGGMRGRRHDGRRS
jgi:hypothetical protein